MAENLVVNGVVYNGVDSIAMQNENGENVHFYPDAVRYNAQALTEDQQAQARQNIGAKSAYEYAKEGGYTGTEEEFATKLAEEYPQPNWNAAEGEPGHVKNRTHYVEVTANALFEGTYFRNSETGELVELELSGDIVAGEKYTVVHNGISYEPTAGLDPYGVPTVGAHVDENGEDYSEYPFCLYYYGDGEAELYEPRDTVTGEYTFAIYEERTEVVHKLDKKFIPDDIGGGVSSWNDLTDKPFGESKNAVLLPETQFVAVDANGIPAFVAMGATVELVEGRTYTVNWNGVDYETVCFLGEYYGEKLMLGNPASFGGNNNNLPFTIGGDERGLMAVPLDGSTSVTVSIRGYCIVPVPMRYLTNALPYYAQMENIGDSDSVVYSTTERVSNLTAMLNSGRDVKIRYIDGNTIYTGSIVCYTADAKPIITFTVSVGWVRFTPQEDDTYTIEQVL